ncbi:MAG TPA: hypothetical protein VGW40_03135 [Allosphingosinicella sp.]|nr:hypothetical protein [Allosphingosinicella sp.]
MWEFIFGISLVSTLGWVLTSWIRARHGYPLENEFSGTCHKDDRPDAQRRIELLTNENQRLTGQVGRLEERIAVLERIATDPAERTAREIERLR